MRILRTAAIAATLVLTACGHETMSSATTSSAPTSSTAKSVTVSTSTGAPTTAGAPTGSGAPTSAGPTVAGGKPTKEFLYGKWGTDGDCTLAIDLRPDGTSDGPFGNWSYTDGAITFADAPELKVNVTVLDDQTMESTNDQGKRTKMTRCP